MTMHPAAEAPHPIPPPDDDGGRCGPERTARHGEPDRRRAERERETAALRRAWSPLR
jgi:hypothetical protein